MMQSSGVWVNRSYVDRFITPGVALEVFLQKMTCVVSLKWTKLEAIVVAYCGVNGTLCCLVCVCNAQIGQTVHRSA